MEEIEKVKVLNIAPEEFLKATKGSEFSEFGVDGLPTKVQFYTSNLWSCRGSCGHGCGVYRTSLIKNIDLPPTPMLHYPFLFPPSSSSPTSHCALSTPPRPSCASAMLIGPFTYTHINWSSHFDQTWRIRKENPLAKGHSRNWRRG